MYITVGHSNVSRQQDVPHPQRSRGRRRGGQLRTGSDAAVYNQVFNTGNILLGKDKKTQWTVQDPSISTAGRLQQQNILTVIPGPSPYAKRFIQDNNCTSAWRLLFNDKMLKHIQKCTIEEAKRQLEVDNWYFSLDELDAFIALLYARGALGMRSIELDELWSVKWGPPIFRETMARNRFREILRFLRFDMKSTRAVRLQSNKFALAAEIWDEFISNCILCYIPGPNLTADEQLFPSKARCPFTQYIANKPDKFGIKFWLLADVDSKYMCNGFPYLGKDVMRPGDVRISEHVVMKLAEPFLKKGRNITTDNFFTSVSLAEKLKSADTSLVGTVNKARKEIPPAVQQSKATLYDTKLLKKDSVTLTVYQGKAKKNVLVMSTLHPSISIAETEKKVPEPVQFYNSTKYGVDVVDQMARQYSTRSGTRRWPVHVFQNILDLSVINSWVCYKEITKSKMSRRNFILKLVDELRTNYTRRKRQHHEVSSNESEDDEPVERLGKRRQCYMKNCGNKTPQLCKKCKKPSCGKHSKVAKITCLNC